MTRYGRDPYWLTAKWAGKCDKCGAVIRKGDKGFYYPNTKTLFCGGECGKAASADFSACLFDERQMGGY